ncbi:alpha/beta fold hydrolase [Cohnella nanjingensis]|uniref:Alpha/beta fold hydrolase n=1 Tax=Cohnella nanjingensis TaxID=1387779 RepID=A0A7X0RPP4_9BACL|nr:alpha/beta fold hydrolase [Cohnella nanjingensis]MBB6670125.1 alpha/beta fold hydrolase [Cohnella nanjingensis]
MAFYMNGNRRNYFIEFGNGRPVILLHGISNSGRAWSPQIAPLVDAGFRVVVPDHAGHGASAKLDRPFGVSDIAGDVIALLDHLSIEVTDIIGLSLGGMAALEIALTQSRRVRKLIVANSFETSATEEFRTMAEGWARTFRSENGPVKRLEGVWPMNVNEGFRATAEGMKTYQVWHGLAATADGRSLAYVAEGIVGFDATARLESLSMPVLFIAGEQDKMSPPAVSRRMADRVLDARYVEIQGAAHISNADSAAAFNEAVITFLGTE